MADYIYLLQNQLTPAQREALLSVRDIVRGKGLTLFLTGGAVRDLTAGASVRDLDVTVQGNASKLKKDLEKVGASIDGENDLAQSLYVTFAGGVRIEISSAATVTFPKPGKPVYKPASILDDLRGRDFTANAMAISLNEGSYGLLMDPMNGVADIENRELRLISNYGFIEDPIRLLRAARLRNRLGWELEEKTATRYQTAKEEDYISALSASSQGYELEEIAHEEDPLRTLRMLEEEGWLKFLSPVWSAAKVDAVALGDLQKKNAELHSLGIIAYPDAVQLPSLISKLEAKEAEALKAQFPRQGFVAQAASLEEKAKALQAKLISKEFAVPSAAWKLLHAADPETVLALYATSKNSSVQNKFKAFLNEWPNAKQRIPYQLMSEMRIVPELPVYNELLEKLFFELMDGKLGTVEEMKAYLEPFSPPAPPPPVTLRRARAKKEARSTRGKGKKAEKVASIVSEDAALEEAADELGKAAMEGVDPFSGSSDDDEELEPAAPKAASPAKTKPAKAAPVAEKKVTVKKEAAPAPAKTAKAEPKPAVKKVAEVAKKAAPVKAVKKAVPAKPVAKKAAPAPAKKEAVKAPAKTVAKKAAPAKAVKKAVPAKKVVKKVVKKVAKKR